MDPDDPATPLSKWSEIQPSVVLDHGAECCGVARAWFHAADATHAAIDDADAPSWLRRFKVWGPAPWPCHWCEVASFETWDCGHYAAVATTLLQRRGYQVMGVQLAQEATRRSCEQWRAMWEAAGLLPSWVGNELVYHEACAITDQARRVRVWDPTENLWLTPGQDCAQAQNRAVRFVGSLDVIEWERARVSVGAWIPLVEERK